jgi:hypothetical protein
VPRSFSQFRARFYGLTALGQASGSGTNQLWYSLNDGLVHWVGLDSELWAYNGTREQISAQQAWLEADLASVDRSKTPWVVVFIHKADYMDATNLTAIFPTLTAGKVDLYICGHVHNAYRALTVYNGAIDPCVGSGPNYPVYTDCKNFTLLVVGSPGNREGISQNPPPKGTAFTSNAYGYGHLQVVNASHLHWTWEETGQRSLGDGSFQPVAGAATDEFWLINNDHLRA